ncbi:hypothetical protein HQQ82_01160 [Rathayibacter sp. VKM Ac-2856]|uniref:hypothetical protein n=1 Tax=unclassified Rathayibacter TaxID=2609250 RepID=UPI0015653C12|nr:MULTISPECIES: hypothetical protein [unclassified Rathayibacter]NQX03404.1 hypothetical protein [Rathayibacter sp. VKM Ac-2858]NQX18572.1 hypothetical protein [Rathayibacter sp. VKM Ac-2856]
MYEKLVILASSQRPDVYFNIIAHNALLGVREYVIATISGSHGQTSAERATELQIDLTSFVAALKDSRYLAASDATVEPSALKRPSRMSKFFRKIEWGSLEFTFISVEQDDLEGFLRKYWSDRTAFDVTACKNTALAGAVAWIVSRGGCPIYSLEMLKNLSFGEEDLLPNLEVQDFQYIDLSHSRLIRGATRRINKGTIHRRRFWIISAGSAVAIGSVTYFAPEQFASSVLAAAASLATIISTVAVLVRNPDQ